MTQITKKVANFIPAGQTYQVFTEADAGIWDFIMVKDSLLGRPATKITIEASDAITLKFNTLQTLHPPRKQGEGFSDQGLVNVSSGISYVASGEVPDYVIESSTTVELVNEFAISDIWIVDGGTDYIITVT